jgi:hypothetical protein
MLIEYCDGGDLALALELPTPPGFLMRVGVAIAAGMTFVAAIWTLATGRTVWPVYERLLGARLAWFAGIAALLAWGYKTALMRGWMG